jgi:hypothetical protein
MCLRVLPYTGIVHCQALAPEAASLQLLANPLTSRMDVQQQLPAAGCGDSSSVTKAPRPLASGILATDSCDCSSCDTAALQGISSGTLATYIGEASVASSSDVFVSPRAGLSGTPPKELTLVGPASLQELFTWPERLLDQLMLCFCRAVSS